MPDTLPIETTDPINARILAVSEDRIQGYPRDPMGEIGRLAHLPAETVRVRLQAMLRAGVIRRIRQTLLATSLAEGALCAWQVPADRLDSAFDTLFQKTLSAGTSSCVPQMQPLRVPTTSCGPPSRCLKATPGKTRGLSGADHWR